MKVTNFTTSLTLIITVLTVTFFMDTNKMGNGITCQLLVVFAITLIIIQMMLVMTSIRWIYSIRLTCTNLQSVSQDFSNSFTKGKEEVILLHKELRELSILTSKKEQQILHITFHVDEIEKYVKTLLDEIREESKFSKEKGQLTK